MPSIWSRFHGAQFCTLSLRAAASTWCMSWSPGEESSLSGGDMAGRTRQSYSIEETAGSLAMNAMV
eukprot:scaffold63803_cov58-Phaeocystis_antarctica.AAC.3